MIELSCPQCQSDLEIDDGFRGGVCRCFSCGTLMTVPDDPDAAAPERIERPDTPGGPSPSDSQPITAEPDDEVTTYRTSTGRVVELSQSQINRAPTARKRRVGVRVGTMAVLLTIMAAMFGGVMYSVVTLMAPEPELSAADLRLAEFGYDATVNPYTLDKPNFMGVPVKHRVVLMSDSSSAMRGSIDLVKQAMIAAVANMPADRQVLIAFWNETAPIVHPTQLTAATEIGRETLQARLADIYPSGGVLASPTIARTLSEDPDQIILVAKQLPMPDEVAAIVKQIEDAGVRFDVFLLDGTDEAIKKAAEASGGNYVELPMSQLQAWYQQYLDVKRRAENTAAEGQ